MLRGNDELAMRHAVRGTDVLRGFGAAYVALDRPASGPGEEAPGVLALEGLRPFWLDFGELVQRRPTDGHSFGNQAQLAVRRAVQEDDPGKALRAWDEAVELLSSALVTNPLLAPALCNRGVCHMRRDELLTDLGDYVGAAEARRQAHEDLERCLALDGTSVAALANRGLLSFRLAQLAFLGVLPADPQEQRRLAHEDLRAALERTDADDRPRIDAALAESGGV